MAETVYILCALTSLFCAVLLFRSYRKQRTRLLMWSTLCFVGLAFNNILLFVDLVLIPHIELTIMSVARNGIALAAVLLLLIGLIWEDS